MQTTDQEEKDVELGDVYRTLHYLLHSTLYIKTTTVSGTQKRIDKLLKVYEYIKRNFPKEGSEEWASLVLTRADQECVRLMKLKGRYGR